MVVGNGEPAATPRATPYTVSPDGTPGSGPTLVVPQGEVAIRNGNP